MAKKQTENPNAAFNIPIFTPENKDKLETFFEEYKKPVTYVLSVILIVLIGIFGYKSFILKPKEKEAREFMYTAEKFFSVDSFELALYGKSDTSATFYGFLDIIDDYGMTESGNLAKYYAGLCYLHMGEYEDAISYLKKYRTNSDMLKPLSLGALGDAYTQVGEYDKAVDQYMKAAKSVDNKFTTPLFYLKAGKTLEANEKYQKALEVYQIIKDDYPKTQEGANVDKYIGRVKAKLAMN